MDRSTGEMSFLDHLEELRWRILWSLAAVVVGVGVGLWVVQQFRLVNVLKAPIAPYLPDGRLIATSPTDPFLIVLKVGLAVGLVLASPIVLWQVWAFVAPALYEREKKALVPALFIGLGLFLTGATLAYLFVVPAALRVLFSFQNEAIAPFITADAYFGFVLQLVLALGLSFELPLVIVILAWLGIIGASELRRFRRYAIVLSFIAGAVLSPGADVLSMIMMTAPLIVLYEIGVLGAAVVGRRRRRQAAFTAGVLAVLCVGGGTSAEAQVPVQRPSAQRAADSARVDSVPGGAIRPDTGGPGQGLDSATAERMGLPTGPSRSFAAPDSVTRSLLDRQGYRSTRYRSDSAVLYVQDERMLLLGEALTERDGSMLEADTIGYQSAGCLLDASGDPRLFDHGQVLVGQGIRYNSCNRRGVVDKALTSFTEGGTVWRMRGNISQDSSSKRIYAGSSEITSCDLPVPHYYFSARQVKWISKEVLVARPVVLYIADVPVLWLPFMFQDMRPGRHSGILVPHFGLNDLVRTNRSYNRQVSNIGYYWAVNDYFDLTARFDWYANRYVQYGFSSQYRWLNRFINGGISWNTQREVGGTSGMSLQWNHQQQFSSTTNLNLNLNYSSNTNVVRRNAIDPALNTQQITSSLNFSKRLDWGTLTIGGSRRQSLTDRSVQQTFPTLSLSPVPIEFGSNVTWSPGFSLNNNTSTDPSLPVPQVLPGGVLDTLLQSVSRRTTDFNLDTPLRIGSFNWQNSVQVTDGFLKGRDSVGFRVDNRNTPIQTDSVTVSRIFPGSFQTSVDWNTGINLPILFRGSWKLQPVLGIANATSAAPFAVRNRNTNGDFVVQGKRFRFGLSAAPTLFAFFPGIGPLGRIRHSFSPMFSYNYAPASSISETFARAIAAPGQPIVVRSDPTQSLTVSLSQVFEGKFRPAAGDTLGTNVRKIRLLSISTSGVTYDFERAKQPGLSGWVTQTINNSLLSELLPGFSLNFTHDLWRGAAGSDTSHFDPFLQNVSANFSVSSRTFCAIGSVLGLCRGRGPAGGPGGEEQIPASYVAGPTYRQPGAFTDVDRLPTGRGRSFTANFNYGFSRSRPTLINPSPDANQTLRFSTSFSPTSFWALSWSSMYNITKSKFEDQVVRLDRDLHEWRAGFSFIRNANGNFAFYFSVQLTDLPDLKFDYDQTTFER